MTGEGPEVKEKRAFGVRYYATFNIWGAAQKDVDNVRACTYVRAQEVPMSFAAFQRSEEGGHLRPLLMDAVVVAEMEALSRAGRPAVIALDRRADQLPSLGATDRQHVGRWIRDVLGARGWRPAARRRVAKGKVFTSGAVYERTGPAAPAAVAARAGPPALTTTERLERARAIIRSLPRPLPTVDEFIAEKRREARREQ